MNRSAQAIVVDQNSNIYLEDNAVIGSLSFIGGKLELGEEYLDAVKREVREELGLTLPNTRFLAPELQPERTFAGSSWISTYFVLELSDSEVKSIVNNATIDLLSYDFKRLQQLDEDRFPIERIAFLQQVQRALDSVM